MLGKTIPMDRIFLTPPTPAGHAPAWYKDLQCNVGVLITCVISTCVVFTAERECPVFEEEVSSAVMFKPKLAAWRLLSQMSR